MNRTTAALFAAVLPTLALAQEQPAKQPELDPVAALIQAMADADRAATTLQLQLQTMGEMPGGLKVTTAGTLRVLREGQPNAKRVSFHSALTYQFGDGLAGVVESNATASGVEIYEENPAFGEVYVHIAPSIVTDLQWAGEVLERTDLPGMVDGRADAPLGSKLLQALQRQFALTSEVGQRGDDAGTWLRGGRRAAATELDADLPRADRVAVFVRKRDLVLLEMTQYQGEREVQKVVVQDVVLGQPLTVADLRVNGREQKLREVQQYLPLWEQIEDLLSKAESRAPDDAVRPSKR